jgi:twitching motility protein PilT
MVDYINQNKKVHILTIEDPIEFVYEPNLSLINQRELGTNTHSFANALRSALREDPDVIMVGEMRDLETISLAMTAAETGHLVFATLHTSSAAKTVDRVIDVFPPAQQSQIRTMFSESILAVITQNLLKRSDGKGRIAALEIMIGTPAIRNLIREGKVAQIPGMMQTGKKFEMQTMDATLADLYNKGVVSKEVVTPYLTNPSVLTSY